MKLAELMRAWITTTTPCDVAGIHNDSRHIKPGYLFIAYPGAKTDGRLFIQQAVGAGAAAVAYDPVSLPPSCMLPSGVPCLPVPQLAQKLGPIANQFYHFPSRNLQLTGITGTNGKTTIAYQLAQAHTLLNNKAAYIGTIGQGEIHALHPLENTTPDALYLQQLLHGYKETGIVHVCMEVSSHALTQGRVEGVEFDQAIYTNLSHEHLDVHHTMQEYAEAKAKLFAKPSLQCAILNRDASYFDLMQSKLHKTCKRITYGMQSNSDVRAVQWQTNLGGSQVEVASPWGTHHLELNLIGEFNIYNSLAVWASLLAYGYEPSSVIETMAKLRSSPGRMEVVSRKPCVIVDYAHTPDALQNALSSLAQLKKHGRLWVVFGCGGDRDTLKRPLMGSIAEQYADSITITSDNPRSEDPEKILDEIAAGIRGPVPTYRILEREQAIKKTLSMAASNDIILVAGKGHENYQIIGQERKLFSDQEIIRQIANN